MWAILDVETEPPLPVYYQYISMKKKKNVFFFSRRGSEHDPKLKMHDPQMCTTITASPSVRQWSVNENAHNS